MGAPGNPMLMQLLQGLGGRLQGGAPGSPPGPGMPPGGDPAAALGAVRETSQTPFGQEYEELERLKSSIQALVPRLLTRIPKVAPDIARCINSIDKAQKALRESPQMPVGGPPPGLPMPGGPGMPPPPQEPPPAFM